MPHIEEIKTKLGEHDRRFDEHDQGFDRIERKLDSVVNHQDRQEKEIKIINEYLLIS